MTFYMTYGRRDPSAVVPWAEENDVPLMTSAASRWSPRRERFKDMWEYDTLHAIDSGGYNSQSSWVRSRIGSPPPKLSKSTVSDVVGDNYQSVLEERESPIPFYPYSVEEYHEWLESNSDEFEWAAVMDYACEEHFDPLFPRGEKIEATIANTLRHFDLDPDYDLYPVLQGRTLGDYLHTYHALDEHGIPLDRVGLGTVCRISSSRELVELERKIRKYMPKIDHIHAFGVKIEAFKLGSTFDSADSNAWVYEAARGNSYTGGAGGMEVADGGEFESPTLESFKSYYEYASSLHESALSS